MDAGSLDKRIKARGRDFFASISGETPSIFNKNWWSGKVMDWAMRDEHFKVQLFRFVDVLPCLATDELLVRHLEEYFVTRGHDVPPVLKWGVKTAKCGGIAGRVLGRTLRANIESMARQFIIGTNAEEAIKTLHAIRQDNFAFTVDILGEACLSAEEEIRYQQSYLDLLDVLGREQQNWQGLGNSDSGLDWGHAPRINIAVKPSTLYSQVDPACFDVSVAGVVDRLLPLATKAKQIGAFLCIDMEQFKYKDITLAAYRRLRSAPELRDYPHLGIALQSYLRQTDQDLDDLLGWARMEKLPISIRLVKGAYWDYETVMAEQNGWQVPVYTIKAESDAAFERQAEKILQNSDICHLGCASHNIRSIAAVMETAVALNVPEERYEFQVLYGMAEPVRKGLQKVAGRVRLYCPFGELLPGMAYLVRRLLENTSNESFLRQSFVEEMAMDRLLENPLIVCEQAEKEETARQESGADLGEEGRGFFKNEPMADFTVRELREAFPVAIAEIRESFGTTHPLLINGQEVAIEDKIISLNPADPDEIVGHICQASRAEIDRAIAAAQKTFPAWRDTPFGERAEYLFMAADRMREDIVRLSALQVLEVGKQWGQAYGDVTEAIDFLEYYGREMLRLGPPRRLGSTPGEVNHYFYQPRGVTAVIAPWNFPLAISCGMCAAAIVTGNTVLYKPSGLSGVIGAGLVDIFQKVGLPAGVLNFVPARGSVVGDYLVEHPGISVIVFTGSEEVGLGIAQKAAVIQPGQRNVKKVIAEMGGKNAVIVDDDADLDQAVLHVLHSAFGFQGQKCSACSRVIVLAPVYDRFVSRLVEAARTIRIGPAEDSANFMGPVVDEAARQKIMKYIEIGKKEGSLLLSREMVDSGFYVPLTIFGETRPEHRLAREEIFGPVLSIMRADTFDQAIDMANSTSYALTGGVFSRSPCHLDQARESFRVGNLYLNRGVTGALVGRQPFGGFRMSGIGSKAGGPDYLLQFMEPRTVTENTMRRGFAPDISTAP